MPSSVTTTTQPSPGSDPSTIGPPHLGSRRSTFGPGVEFPRMRPVSAHYDEYDDDANDQEKPADHDGHEPAEAAFRHPWDVSGIRPTLSLCHRRSPALARGRIGLW